MSLWRMAWRYLWSRAGVTVLTLAGVALGSGLIAGVLTLRRETERTFLEESGRFDLVVGAKGSPLQLVLSSVYHLDIPTGNIPYEQYEALKKDKRVTAAYPVALGDNHRGFRIVGTVPEFFEMSERGVDEGEASPLLSLREGRVFEGNFEAVLGAEAARQTKLGIGDTFVGAHGLATRSGPGGHDNLSYTVTGILKQSGSSNDRAIFTSIGTVWSAHGKHGGDEVGHDEHDGHGEAEGDDRGKNDLEVTAILVTLKSPGLRMFVAEEIKRETVAMAAIPINEMHRLYTLVLGPAQATLLAVAYAVVVVAALSIWATLSQAAERRRRDLAVMRSLGAHPREIFCLAMMEAFLLTVLGIGIGWALGHLGVGFGGIYLRERMGLAVSAWSVSATEIKALGAVAAMGLAAGLGPAVLSYRRAPVEDL